MKKTKRTNVELDIEKLRKAKKVVGAAAGLFTTKDVIDFALMRLVTSSDALRAIVRSQVKFDANYDYKASR
ncbi:hypothetical protein WDW86_04350 [Bdellovibrionota bacterium FG-2]